jgi:serine/threonine protein kinase
MTKIEINDVKNRFLPISESVQQGLEPEPKITDFTISKELGAGSFGHVYLVTHKKTKANYAIKAIDKRNKSNIEEKPYFRREVEVMYKIHHPNVVKLYGHFEDNNYCYFIMEYIPKGNVFGLIPQDKKKRVSTQLVASLIKDVISAVYFLHNMNPPIIHRDIKPENVLLTDTLAAKLTDFGWSNYIQEDEKRTTVCGTPIYLAPEIIKEKGHDEKVDIWCIGVLLFELATGSVPFPGNDIETLENNILKLKIQWPKDINLDIKNLIMKILKLDPKARISLSDMMQHHFITKYFPDSTQYLIKPNDNAKYRPFIVSKDDPNNWDPIIHENNNIILNINNNIKEEKNEKIEKKEKSPEKEKVPTDNKSKRKEIKEYTLEDLKNLKEKYEMLDREYNILKNKENENGNKPIEDQYVNNLINILKEKEEKVAQLLGLIKEKGQDIEIENNESYLKMKVDELEKENQTLQDKINRYEQFINNQQSGEIEGNLKELRDSMTNKEKFSNAIEKLKFKINEEAKKNLNEIINEKEKEIEKIKELEKIRREKEQLKFKNIINKYDKTLNYAEKENKELKTKLKLLLKK